MHLTSLTQSLTAVLSGTVTTRQLPITGSYEIHKPTGERSGLGSINSVTADTVAATILAQTGAGPGGTGLCLPFKLIQLQIKNSDTVSATVTITFVDTAGTDRVLFKSVLAADDILCYTEGKGWYVVNSAGATKTSNAAVTAATVIAAVTDSTSGVTSSATLVSTIAKSTLVIPVGTLALVADTNTFSIAVPYAATIVAARWITDKPVTTANKATTFTITTTGGSVTGGVMALSSTATSNVQTTNTSVAATAISGANATLTAGQRVIVTASATTTFIEGEGHLEIDVLNVDLNNAVALMASRFNAEIAALKVAGLQASS